MEVICWYTLKIGGNVSNIKDFEETVDRVFDRCRKIFREEGFNDTASIMTREYTFEQCRNLLIKKGAEYAGNVDRYANFKRQADALGMTSFEIWAVYFNKHVDAINSAIKRNPEMPTVLSEPLEGRIQDNINYLLLDLGMTIELAGRTMKSEEGNLVVNMLEIHVTEMIVLLVKLADMTKTDGVSKENQ